MPLRKRHLLVAFFSLIFRQLVFYGKFGPQPNIFGEERKKVPGGQASGWACRTRMQKFQIPGFLENGVYIFGFLRVKMSKMRYFQGFSRVKGVSKYRGSDRVGSSRLKISRVGSG